MSLYIKYIFVIFLYCFIYYYSLKSIIILKKDLELNSYKDGTKLKQKSTTDLYFLKTCICQVFFASDFNNLKKKCVVVWMHLIELQL